MEICFFVTTEKEKRDTEGNFNAVLKVLESPWRCCAAQKATKMPAEIKLRTEISGLDIE